MDVGQLNTYLKEASGALLADCGYKAVQIFRGPLRHFIESPKLQSFEECDIVCIKYSYAVAYCKSGGYDDLQKCISVLKDIIETHDAITFPAAYYMLGLAYRKLNRFKESLTHLEIVENFLHKGIHFKVYPWPGMTTVIQETKPETLKALVQELKRECENPPNPDATCRYGECEFHPPIYYTDPNFKGYVSIFCSDQCCLQYHSTCWKTIKAERNLTEKEFLEKGCFTPDCEGSIIKIQSIDKKGNLSKEFTSDSKKHSKHKWGKLDKKPETKEKKRKKANSRSEDPTGERKNSLRAESESPTSQLSSQSSSVEEGNKENHAEIQKTTEHSEKLNGSCTSSENTTFETVKAPPIVVEASKETTNKVQENGPAFFVVNCIKNNIYTRMNDFLQQHGPLKVDDPLLVAEMASLPAEALSVISECGGIAEFLKRDMRFAYVGDLYLCVVSDLATAYKMCSSSCLPEDFKNLQSLEHSIDPQCYGSKCNQNTALNPDAVEYTPPAGVRKKSRELNSDSPSFVPTTFKPPCTYTGNSSDRELHVNSKSKSCEVVASDKLLPSAPEFRMRSDASMNGMPSQRSAFSEPLNSSFKVGGDSSLESQLLALLTVYHGEGNSRRQTIDSYLKPFVIKKQTDVSTSGTMTDSQLTCTDMSEVAVTENRLLREKMNSIGMDLIRMRARVAESEKLLQKEQETKRESLRKELEEMSLLRETLKTREEFSQKLEHKVVTLINDKTRLEKRVQDLLTSLEEAEGKASAFEAKEEQLNDVIRKLQEEREALRNRVKYAELQVLYLKKTDYLRRIDEKIAAAAERRQDCTDALSIVYLNPVLQSNMSALSTQLLSYITTLNSIKVEFTRKIDQEIEKLKNGLPLNETKEVELEKLPEVPSWKTSFPANVPDQMPMNNSFPMSLNFLSRPQPTFQRPSAILEAPVIPAAEVPVPKAVPVIPPVLPTSAQSVSKMDLTNGADALCLHSQIEESYKSAMASINSYATTAPPHTYLDQEFHKNCAAIQDPTTPIKKPDAMKVPPGIETPTPNVPERNSLKSSVVEEPASSGKEKRFDCLDAVPMPRPNSVQGSSDTERKKATGQKNYQKLLNKLTQIFPQYNVDQLMCFVKEYREQRKGTLSGLPMDTIINEIGNLIVQKKNAAAEKKVCDQPKPLPKSVLVNKKLVPDPKPEPPPQSQGGAKKKSAWNTVDPEARRNFSGNPEDDCTICYDPMTSDTAFKVSCGHTFHETCIRKWLLTNMTCPVCRVMLLLDDDFPSLS